MNPDGLLLHRFVKEGSQSAFTELVHRHLDLVYAAAMRRTGGDSHQSADVCQHVFISLAKNAGTLARHPALCAWLHTATRNAALNLMTAEQRRKSRESIAAGDPASTADEPVLDWPRLRPLLDETIDDLADADRTAVVLRFLEGLPFAEVGARLHVSEDAARMRTERALERMRTSLARRGIQSTAAALGAAVLAQPAISAPAGLAASIAAGALSLGGATAIAASIFSVMTPKLVTLATVSACLAFGAGYFVKSSTNRSESSPPPGLSTAGAHAALENLRLENQRLQGEVSRLTGDLGRLVEENTRLAAMPAPSAPPATKGVTLGMSRGEIQQAVLNNLRQLAAARDQYALENGRPAATIRDLVGATAYIKQLRSVDGESYADLLTNPRAPLTVTTLDGVVVTYDPAGNQTTQIELSPEALHRQQLERRVSASMNKALAAYLAANPGSNPPNPQAIIPYFATTEEGADFVELMELQKTGKR